MINNTFVPFLRLVLSEKVFFLHNKNIHFPPLSDSSNYGFLITNIFSIFVNGS